MRVAEAKRLKKGDRVQFQDDLPNEDSSSCGTVTHCDSIRFTVKWDDGVECSYPHILATAIQHEEQG